MNRKKAALLVNKDFECLASAIEGLHAKGASDQEIFRILILVAGGVIHFGAHRTFTLLMKPSQ